MTDDYGNVVNVPSKPQAISETVLEDAATHPAYMELLREGLRNVRRKSIDLGANVV